MLNYQCIVCWICVTPTYIGVSRAKGKTQVQKLKQQLEKGLELVSELSLELTDAERLDTVIKLLPYLELVTDTHKTPEKSLTQFLPETFPEGVLKSSLKQKQLYETYLSWCELKDFPPASVANFSTFWLWLGVERQRDNKNFKSIVYPDVYDVLDSETPKWPQSID